MLSTRKPAIDLSDKPEIHPLFQADWQNVVFIHLELDPRILQPVIPFDLDLWEGRAFVSLVAFTQCNLVPAFGGPFARFLSAPLAHHEFLNVRTYVRHHSQPGIFFIAEWIPNRLAAFIGPRMYGLPYRLGKLAYHHQPDNARFTGCVRAGDDLLSYSATADPCHSPQAAERNSVAEFLLERYVAFTARHGVLRRFDVRHAPWPLVSVDPQLHQTTLLHRAGSWCTHARLHSAHASAGVQNVEISRPMRVDA